MLLGFIGASVVLFGGWFVYRSMAMESPLAAEAMALPGVREAEIRVTDDTIQVTLRLAPDADMRRIVAGFREIAGQRLDRRELKVKVDQPPSETLERWWAQALFEVAEAMDNREYTRIPEALERRRAELPGLEADASMDDEYVYVRLALGQESKFVLLPRHPSGRKGVEG